MINYHDSKNKQKKRWLVYQAGKVSVIQRGKEERPKLGTKLFDYDSLLDLRVTLVSMTRPTQNNDDVFEKSHKVLDNAADLYVSRVRQPSNSRCADIPKTDYNT